MNEHLNLRLRGMVQGVGFRYYMKQKAKEIGVMGYAKNEPGGSVYSEVEGERRQLEDFVKWCRKGPTGSQVKKVEQEYTKDLKNFTEFSINQ